MKTDLSRGHDIASALALQSDGKAVVLGYTIPQATCNLVRYNEDGSIDQTVGYDFGFCKDVAIQPDGKILLAGSGAAIGRTDTDLLLLRLNPDLTFDGVFGGGGKVSVDFGGGSDDSAWAVTLQSDGKIVLAGSKTFGPSGFAPARFAPDGSLDASFGPNCNGLAETPFPGASSSAIALALDGDGRMVTVGGTDFVGGDFAVARWNPGEYPVSGVAWSIPGKIEAEDYYNGGPDIAYSDTTVNLNEAGGIYQSSME